MVAEQALGNGTWRRFFGGGEATGSRWRGSDFSGQQSGGPHVHVAFFTRLRRRSPGDSLRRQGAHRRATVGPCRPKVPSRPSNSGVAAALETGGGGREWGGWCEAVAWALLLCLGGGLVLGGGDDVKDLRLGLSAAGEFQ
jgi:hypothetical protein